MGFCKYLRIVLSRFLKKCIWRRKYLSDPTEDVRVATENLLADFLKEIRDISIGYKNKEALQLSEANYNAAHIDKERVDSPYLAGENPDGMVFTTEGGSKEKVIVGEDLHCYTGGKFTFFLA